MEKDELSSCSQCGATIQPDEKFCAKCGAKISNVPMFVESPDVGILDKKICCICRNTITDAELVYPFPGQIEDEKEICSTCMGHYDVLMESKEPNELKNAINYLYTCSLSVNDEDVASFLKIAIEENSSVVSDMEYEAAKFAPVDMKNKRNYFSDRQLAQEEDNHSESMWISGMRIFAWIFSAAIVIIALVYIVKFKLGFLVFIESVIIAFITLALMMIYLDMASDISEIKAILKSRRNQT